MQEDWKEYKKIATETSSSIMHFFKLETAVANVPISQFLISSLYRSILINDTKPTDATINADYFHESLKNLDLKLPKHLTNHQFHDILNGSLNIPKGGSITENQYLISPLIPEIATFGGNMRRGSSWNSGGFILEIIANSSKDDTEFINITEKLFNSLSAESLNNGRIWNDFLRYEFAEIADSLKTKFPNLSIDIAINKFNDVKDDLLKYRSKRKKKVYHDTSFSRSVITDLKNLCEIEGENKLTRQQWIGLIESYFRLLIFNHSVNTMNQSRSYFSILCRILEENVNKEMLENDYFDFINSTSHQYSNTNKLVKINTRSSEFVNDNIQLYCLYNHFLHYLLSKYNISITSESTKEEIIELTNKLLKNFSSVKELRSTLSMYRKENENLIKKISVKTDRQLAQISECLIYISQKKILPKDLKSYIPDVNNLFSRRSGLTGNPYMFDLGSGTISLLTGLIFKKKPNVNFLSGLDYIQALRDYNIDLTINDISTGNVKSVMQSLGIVIDSPDTEGGILIVKPGWI